MYWYEKTIKDVSHFSKSLTAGDDDGSVDRIKSAVQKLIRLGANVSYTNPKVRLLSLIYRSLSEI